MLGPVNIDEIKDSDVSDLDGGSKCATLDRYCSRCQQSDHLVEDGPWNVRAGTSYFRCKQKGHLVEDCPLKVKTDQTNREKIRLCIDAGSVVGIATSRKGIHYFEKCRHVVESADKEQEPLVVTEKGDRIFRSISSTPEASVAMLHYETYIVESCPKDICSLLFLVRHGYKWIPSHGNRIELRHPNVENKS